MIGPFRMFHHIFLVEQYVFELSLGVHHSLVAKMFRVDVATVATGQ